MPSLAVGYPALPRYRNSSVFLQVIVTGPSKNAILLGTVGHIVRLSTQKQVTWVDTRPNVAMVA
jgi:hypothetical protein